MLLAAGARDIVLCDRAGALYAGRTEHMNEYKTALAAVTNPDRERGRLHDVLRGSGCLHRAVRTRCRHSRRDIATMGSTRSCSRMANPTPEVQPEELVGIARVVATGRSDYPNQINNSLVVPGHVSRRTRRAGHGHQRDDEAGGGRSDRRPGRRRRAERGVHRPEHVRPRVAESVAQAVALAAVRSGVARGHLEQAGAGFQIRQPERRSRLSGNARSVGV